MKMRRLTLNRQTGIALFISLVLLLVLTIAGVSAVQTTSLEERMARNSHDTLLAFQAAESALKEAELWLPGNINSTAPFTNAGTNGLWTTAIYGNQERWADPNTWNTGANKSVQAATAMGQVAEQPRYIIEWIATVERSENSAMLQSSYNAVFDRIEIFRITARGTGGSTNAQVMLQSNYGLIF